MKQATLLFIVNENKILLGMKKRGFGEGKWNGFGGKVEEGETYEEAAIREIYEEAGIVLEKDKVSKVGEIDFTFPFVPKEKKFDQTVHIFIANEFGGNIVESEEMFPSWFEIEKIPFEAMWKSDTLWLPKILNGEKVKGNIVFGEDNGTPQDHNIENI